jgi:UDPglucose 6-dehydrogenase
MDRAKKEWKALHELEYARSVQEVFEESDAVCLVTEWPEFGKLDFATLGRTMKNKFVLDGRGLLDAGLLRELGIKTTTLGKSN